MSERIVYAGYGAMREVELMEALTGETDLYSHLGRLQGVELCIQGLDQIPDVAPKEVPPELAPRRLLEATWGGDFKAYGVRPKVGEVVVANLFRLTPLQIALVEEWEMVSLGLHKPLELEVVLVNKAITWAPTAITYGLAEDAPVERVVDGRNYRSFLNDEDRMIELAAQTRRDYLAR